jgi:hypothetical protein
MSHPDFERNDEVQDKRPTPIQNAQPESSS